MEKAWLCTAKTQLGLAHRTVRWCTGQCPVRQADSAQRSRSREFADGVRLKFTGLSGGAPDSVRCARLTRRKEAALGNSPMAYG
jgi:hypothetical protein